MGRRASTLTFAAAVVVLLTAIAALLPVPYVVLMPGPTSNTLGSVEGQGEVISVSGRKTYPTSGHLQLLTVSVRGGPGARMDLFDAVRGWLDSADAVVPRESVYPEGQTREQARQLNAEEMAASQSNATTAALHYLEIPMDVVVQAVLKDAPAEGVVRAGDVIVAVDGEAVADPEAVRAAISAHEPGDTVVVTVERGGERLRLTLKTVDGGGGRAMIGVTPSARVRAPLKVDIKLEDVGGPSAGMMFALGLIDKLTPGELTGGAFVAGTGTISEQGEVGPIGGIQQKLVGARRAGATVFLAPAANCADTRGAVPDGLRVVKVASLEEAVTALDTLREGDAAKVAALPSCA
ncbi:PDZ domain-containing protein [Motilibacter sp. E257]|uniref:endopeptidase La n=2 Tax=Motilibacter deserti TaxID=2714956 RepID=A0ABX0GU65_9ACTN|nr:PDZ domain-containing protein [Motilibacter deserti]